jgi:integrase
LFALLATTGLRVSEALGLCLQDLTQDGLLIRQTKFRKTRLVPLHPTAQVGLDRYLVRRKSWGGLDDHLFVSRQDTALPYQTVVATFLKLVRAIGLRGGPGQGGPRIHDLRHGFAVRSLEQCPPSALGVTRHMVALSTYLGHGHVAATYWYLHATPRLLETIAAVTEDFLEGGGL